MARIAVIAGQKDLLAHLHAMLAHTDHDVCCFETEASFERRVAGWHPHLALFCWDFEALGPESDFCALRAALSAPVIVIGSQYQETAVVQALKLGADGCLCKPFGRAELVARITASVRRYWEWREEGRALAQPARAPGISSVSVGDHELALSSPERRLLDALRARTGYVVSRDELCQELWGSGGEDMYANLSLCVHSLRKKLEHNPHHPQYILTKWGVGYYLAHEIPEA